MSESGLATAFAEHADGVLEETYRSYGTLLRATARHILGADDDATDVVHDALLRAWSRGTYRPERGNLRAFLVVCVRNEAISRRRNDTRYAALARRMASDQGNHDGIDEEERIAIRAALATLPPEQRDVLELFYWGRYTQAEIAAQLAIPLGTVKGRASLGLRKLASRLGRRDWN